MRLGGKLLAFNVDPAFSNVLDGLILVDLVQTEPTPRSAGQVHGGRGSGQIPRLSRGERDFELGRSQDSVPE
jgi:hypothetical protein